MNEKYSDCVEKVSQILFETIAKREENLKVKIFEIDTDLLSLLRAIGARVMSRRARSLAPFVGAGSLVNVVDNVDYSSNKSSKKKGWKIQRSPQIKYTTIFGQLKIESPYLCHKKLKTGMRPVAEFLGITHGKHSVALTRSLADFGASESFHQASLRFQEHYGFKVSSSKLRREVVKVAELSEKFVEEKLAKSIEEAKSNPNEKTERLLVELDGCHLRTGGKVPRSQAGLTKIRKIKKSSKKIEWKETRGAFPRPVEEKKQRTFVARMAKYSEIIQQLVGAAYDRGLFPRTQIFALADGAIGLKEALEKAFQGLQFILDRPHLKEHLYEGVEAMELPENVRHSILNH